MFTLSPKRTTISALGPRRSLGADFALETPSKRLRCSLRRILAAELQNYERALKKNLQAQSPNSEFFSVGRVHRLFSEQLAADLGLLEQDEIDVVVNALISLDGMEHFLENISSQSSDTRFLLPARAWEEFQMVNSTTADALRYAVQALELSGEA